MRGGALLVALAILACGGGGDKPERVSTRAAGASTSGAVDGAMCAEHGVPEAICTKCNPKLIPVFKAKGDWCEEHGFPESVCPICHPERGGQPTVAGPGDDAPADGTKVRMKSADAARIAGITTARPEARAGGARLEVVATIGYDARKRAELNARAPGVVRTLHVDVGDQVVAGAPLATIDSAAVGGERSRLAAATSRLRIAETNHTRAQTMHAQGTVAETELLAALQELEAARAERAAAAAATGMVGGGTSGSGYVLRSPLAGTVTARRATVGHLVDVAEILFDVVDVSGMRADLEIPEGDLAVVRIGSEVTLAVDGLGARAFTGRIDYIAPEIARDTRTAKARVLLANPDGALRANMFARAQIALGDARPSVMVPQAAIQKVGAVALAFVATAPGEYEARRVTLGRTDGALIEVLTGITLDDAVVTVGSFLLKTETLRGAIGAGCCE